MLGQRHTRFEAHRGEQICAKKRSILSEGHVQLYHEYVRPISRNAKLHPNFHGNALTQRAKIKFKSVYIELKPDTVADQPLKCGALFARTPLRRPNPPEANSHQFDQKCT